MEFRMTTTTAVLCRSLEDNGRQCEDKALPASQIDICARHAALVMTAVRQQATARSAAKTTLANMIATGHVEAAQAVIDMERRRTAS
jgi:hypothetical protein